jgi:hypothetical protein
MRHGKLDKIWGYLSNNNIIQPCSFCCWLILICLIFIIIITTSPNQETHSTLWISTICSPFEFASDISFLDSSRWNGPTKKLFHIARNTFGKFISIVRFDVPGEASFFHSIYKTFIAWRRFSYEGSTQKFSGALILMLLNNKPVVS